ncbi:23143_t:CDS:2 [Gigaspora margarita]|uniref:23143_t:CDS:1 n=1 Tax=Gigaspora margarita TaxID=4874 RepID=A0ABN7UNZ2_GIGMA|nr:23143_t:CDS:2 [Gigaspora margarita]
MLTLNDKNQLEQELYGKLYKPESIISAYTSLRHYMFEVSAIKNVNINDRFQFPILYHVVDRKIMELQDQELGKVDQSKGLTAEEICQILLYLESGEQTALKLT